MAYLNSDDLLLPGTLAYVARFFLSHPKVDVVYGHRVLIDENDREIGRWVLPRHSSDILSWADYVPQETLFWRRRIWERVGAMLDDTFAFAMDWDLLIRLRDAGARFVRLPRFLGAFRVHEVQKTSSRMRDVGVREVARLRRRVHGRPVSAAEVRRRIRGYLVRHMVYQKLYRLGLLRY
jgi:GT2 family glycosyltransferase